jgi:hypothetical protein
MLGWRRARSTVQASSPPHLESGTLTALHHGDMRQGVRTNYERYRVAPQFVAEAELSQPQSCDHGRGHAVAL